MTKKDFIIVRGDDWTLSFQFKDSEGTAIDITGYTLWLTIKELHCENDADDTDAIVQKVVTSHTDATGGLTATTVSAAEADDLEIQRYRYDVQYKKSDGIIVTILSGYIKVVPDITRSTT